MMLLRQVQMSGCRHIPCVANISKLKHVMPNLAPVTGPPALVLVQQQQCRPINTNCGMTWSKSHHIKKTANRMTTALQRRPLVSACRAYATSGSRTNTSEQPQRRVYKLMKIKVKDFEKVNPDTYFEGLEPSMTQAKFDDSKELEDANDMVKKIFSLEIANQKQITEKQVKVLNEKVQLDKEHENKYARFVVKQTVIIRAYSRRLQSYQHRKDVKAKVQLMELIDKRRQLLKRLRKQNYAQFEKVKEVLGIDYIPFGRYDYYPVTKRMKEKGDIITEARKQEKAAFNEYMETVRRPQLLLELAQLKRDLGKELTEEEQERLRQSEEVEGDKK